MKEYLLGNAAIAQGILEAGAHVVTGYPGTPASEIVETLAPFAKQYHLHVEWSVNEKVALEVAKRGILGWNEGCGVCAQICSNKAIGV